MDAELEQVSIHAPVKVRPGVRPAKTRICSFNSRTCEGATASLVVKDPTKAVSIHAPVKVRQPDGKPSVGILAVSIHAPVKVRRRKGICVES